MVEKIWPPSSAFRGRVPDLDAENASLKARLAVFAAIAKDEQNKVAVLTDTIEVQREDSARLRAALEAVHWVPQVRLEPPYPAVPAIVKFCPWCGWLHCDGDAPDCKREAALNPAEEE